MLDLFMKREKKNATTMNIFWQCNQNIESGKKCNNVNKWDRIFFCPRRPLIIIEMLHIKINQALDVFVLHVVMFSLTKTQHLRTHGIVSVLIIHAFVTIKFWILKTSTIALVIFFFFFCSFTQ